MKLLLAVLTLASTLLSIQCRPQTIHPEHRAGTTDVLKLPFYGGARGQILEIRKNSDGTVVSKILRGDDLEEEMELKVQQVADEAPTAVTKAPPAVKATTPAALETDESEYQGSEEDTKSSASSGEQSFGDYLLRIQNAAASLVSLQETVKKTGKLSPDQKKVYAENLEKLGVAAQKLAHIQHADDDQDAIRFLFDSSYETPVSSSSSSSPSSSPSASPASSSGSEKKKGSGSSTSKLTSFPGYKGKEDKDKKKKEEEENVGEEGSGGGDSVQVETQEKESSIAEAKPVGLAIAGEGGVASSKPVATAVVGDGGLAVARPVATAIAGIKPSELGSLGLPISVNKKVLSRGKYGLISSSDDVMSGGLLVGPDYEARVAPKEIEAEIDDNRQQLQQQQQLMANFDTEKFLANLRLKTQPTAPGAVIASIPQTYAAYQPQSYLQQQQQQQQQQQIQQVQQQQQQSAIPYMANYASLYTPTIIPYYSWSPSFYQYQPNPYNSPLAYAQQLDALTQSQYNPYYLAAATASAYQQPSVAAAAAATQNPFQAYEYPQRAALYTPAPVLSPAATAYSNFNNYPSFSTPSPYRFFYY
ncbi:RNA polymerase II degradation factor 1-like isoform X2 [Anopheles albimanus]|uniref:RNA polymerase II degradation factor 1-like isoform X2 n=1 Tax=Anopheles albimanus TaxID=7167 RepID=UPI0016410B4F|nr:RNA polymerase II degradation factor 1-like isoform X2 [Anopheles albimanus]